MFFNRILISHDIEIVSKFIEEDICGFVWASLRLIGDSENVKETSEKNNQSWSYASQGLKIDKSFIIGCLQKDGLIFSTQRKLSSKKNRL